VVACSKRERKRTANEQKEIKIKELRSETEVPEGEETMEAEALATKSSVPYVHLVDDDEAAGDAGDDRQNLLNRPHADHERQFKELEKRQQELYMPGWRGHLQYFSTTPFPRLINCFYFYFTIIINRLLPRL
jgi:hypothetical protein